MFTEVKCIFVLYLVSCSQVGEVWNFFDKIHHYRDIVINMTNIFYDNFITVKQGNMMTHR